MNWAPASNAAAGGFRVQDRAGPQQHAVSHPLGHGLQDTDRRGDRERDFHDVHAASQQGFGDVCEQIAAAGTNDRNNAGIQDAGEVFFFHGEIP